eukprot:m.184257 g.184257  ORF g.184257 m.184257 type:complete len:69 (-) comp53518_c0_seq10:711-917(-)
MQNDAYRRTLHGIVETEDDMLDQTVLNPGACAMAGAALGATLTIWHAPKVIKLSALLAPGPSEVAGPH